MTPVERFLFGCLRSHLHPVALEEARAAAATVADWPAAVAQARAEGVAPLVYAALRGRDMLPPAVEEELRRSFAETGLTNALLLDELSRVLTAFAAHGLRAVVLKGAALAAALYPTPALRPMVDIDLLIKHTDVPAALDLLGALGFVASGAETRPGILLEYENEILLTRAERPARVVELHWSLFNSPFHQQASDATWLWQTAAPFSSGSAAALTLGSEAQLVHLCGHASLHHGGEGLLWQHDIALFLHRHGYALDWTGLIAHARAAGLALALKEIVPPVVKRWGVGVPPQALAALALLQPTPKERRAVRLLRAPVQRAGRRFLADLQMLPSWRSRAAFARANLFPSRVYMRARYGIRRAALLPLYYPYRWLLGLAGAWKSR